MSVAPLTGLSASVVLQSSGCLGLATPSHLTLAHVFGKCTRDTLRSQIYNRSIKFWLPGRMCRWPWGQGAVVALSVKIRILIEHTMR